MDNDTVITRLTDTVEGDSLGHWTKIITRLTDRRGQPWALIITRLTEIEGDSH